MKICRDSVEIYRMTAQEGLNLLKNHDYELFEDDEEECHCGSDLISIEHAALVPLRYLAYRVEKSLNEVRRYKEAIKEIRYYAETATVKNRKGRTKDFPNKSDKSGLIVICWPPEHRGQEYREICEIAAKRGFNVIHER